MADDYEVGDGKPPEKGQFQPGQSGNPKGRPPGTQNLKTDLAEELAERILIREGGQQRAVSKQRAMLKSLMAKAVTGDAKAANIVLRLVERLLGSDDSEDQEEPLAPDDQKILEAFAKRKQAT